MRHFPLYIEFMEMFRNELDFDLFQNISEETTYHLENNNLIHTHMVYVLASNQSIEMGFTALLHDLGKRKSKIMIGDKSHHTQHESVSVFLALNFYQKYSKELDEIGIDKEKFIQILTIVCYHGMFWNKSSKQISHYFKDDVELLQKIYDFSLFDGGGNVTRGEREIKNFDDVFKPKKSKYDIPFEKLNSLPTITILVGVPNSGKSTYCKELNQPIVSRDDILMDYVKRIKKKDCSYNEAWKLLDKDDQSKIDELLSEKFNRLKKDGLSFVVDLTNLSWKSRKKWFCNSHKIKIKTFLTSYNTIMERNKKRSGKVIDEKILINMMKRFEMPLKGEHQNIIDIECILK